jgi:acyl-coenzyme A thioesterase PaaI-like protein
MKDQGGRESMLSSLIERAATSSFHLWMLNRILWHRIPFNAPHSIRLTKIHKEGLMLTLPFKRKNKNHINGIHACALATLCEYASGLQLTRILGADKFRLILREIKMEYLWQAKMDVSVSFYYPIEKAEDEILKPLQAGEKAVLKTLESAVINASGEKIASGFITWQIKSWKEVHTTVK